MIVQMRTVSDAAKVAVLTGGEHLPGVEAGKLSRRVRLEDFEAYREMVERVSVLFALFDVTADGELVEVPSGWTVTGAKFEVQWPQERSVVRSHLGARRFAYNWALGQVKADMDARRKAPEYERVKWTLAALRKRFNAVKGEVAPWWAENSKECYSTGIADLADALGNWSSSKSGERKGQRVGFPRFKARHRDHGRVRFTTGAMRLENDRRTITLPRVGGLRCKENTRRVQRHVASGRARILNMTLSEQWGRLFVSVNYALRTPTVQPPKRPGVRAGVDAGLRTLATIADTEGRITELPNPRALRETLAQRRNAGRQMSRRIPGSRGHRAAKTKLARMDRRAVHLRQQAWHQLTHELTSTYGEVVVEDLNIAAMKKSMGRRAFRRSVSDAAIGQMRPMLEYKSDRTATEIIVADRCYPSSRIHHGCGCRLITPTRMAKQLVCAVTGEPVDRDINAALNLRDWPEQTASPGLVEASAPDSPGPATAGTGPGSDTRPAGAGGATIRPARKGRRVAARRKATPTPQGAGEGATPQGVHRTRRDIR